MELQFSLETLLKSILCLRQRYSLSGEDLVKKVKSYNHNIQKLQEAALKGVDLDLKYQLVLSQCAELSIHFRYGYESALWREGNPKIYYETIGNSCWMPSLDSMLAEAQSRVVRFFCTQKRIFGGNDLIASLEREYPKPASKVPRRE